MKTDIEIAQESTPLHITEIAKSLDIDEKYLEQYGKYKAKVDYNLLSEDSRPDGKLILVTAITPTPAGEGKTTTTVGLADGMRKLGKNAVVALREPSLGPVFGVKGGAAGGGYAQVVPMEDINLHFTGDFHAIGAANNLLAAMLDNHIYQGNELRIDPKRITWRRVVDMNDRQLRNVVDGLGRRVDGVTREDGYDITVREENGDTYMTAGATLYLAQEDAPELFTGSGWSYSTIQPDGYARWYRIGEDAAWTAMSVQVEGEGGFWVYNPEGYLTASSVLWGDTKAPLEEGGLVVFAGDAGSRFHLSFSR